MKKAIPYCGDLHIDAATKKLILNLLASIRSTVPVVNPPEPGTLQQDQDVRSREYLGNTLVLARKHSEELDGLIDPDELLRYSRYISDYEDIALQLENLLERVNNCKDHAWQFASSLAGMLEDHLKMCTPLESQTEESEMRDCIPLSHDKIRLKIV